MKGVLTLFVLLFVGAGAALLIGQRGPVAQTSGVAIDHQEVVLGEKGFAPSQITLKKNGTITFSTDRTVPFWPASDLHPTHSIYQEFDPKHSLKPDESWTFKFERTGTWNFHDHLRSYYTGAVYVVE